MTRWRSFWVRLGVWVLVAAALFASSCKRQPGDELGQESEAEKDKALPALTFTDDTPDLLLTWIDGRGDAHVAKKPADVAAEGRERVRVVVTTREAGTRNLFYVANLGSKNPDGSYVVSSSEGRRSPRPRAPRIRPTNRLLRRKERPERARHRSPSSSTARRGAGLAIKRWLT